MSIDLRRRLSVLTSSLTLALLLLLALPSQAAEKARLRVDDYQIDADSRPTSPSNHRQSQGQIHGFAGHKRRRLRTAQRPARHQGFDEKNQPLSAERVTQDSTVRVPLPAGLSKDASTTLTFEYEGRFENADNSPVPGLKLGLHRRRHQLSALCRTMVSGQRIRSESLHVDHHITLPAHMLVIGSGKVSTVDHAASNKPNASVLPDQDLHLRLRQAEFPGTIVAGVFQEYKSDEAGMDLHVFFKPTHQSLAPAYTTTAVQEFTYYITLYGLAAVSEAERGRDSRRYPSVHLGSGDRRTGQSFDHRENELSAAGRRHRAPVVGSFGESSHQR